MEQLLGGLVSPRFAVITDKPVATLLCQYSANTMQGKQNLSDQRQRPSFLIHIYSCDIANMDDPNCRVPHNRIWRMSYGSTNGLSSLGRPAGQVSGA